MSSSTVNDADDQLDQVLEVRLRCIRHLVAGDSNRAANLQVISLEIDDINYHHTFTPPFPVIYVVPGTTDGTTPAGYRLVLEKPTPAAERFRMEKLEEDEEQDLGLCSICLDEIDCKKCEVVKISCGHVYHKPCIYKWLDKSNSCPLCRTPLLLKDGSD